MLTPSIFVREFSLENKKSFCTNYFFLIFTNRICKTSFHKFSTNSSFKNEKKATKTIFFFYTNKILSQASALRPVYSTKMFSVSPTLSRFVSMLGRVQRRLRPRSEAYTLVIWLGLLYTLCAWMLWVLATSPCLPTIDGWDAEGARPGTVHHWIETMEQHSLNTANETYMQTNDAGSECSCECRDFWLWNCSYSYSYTLRVVYLLIAIHNRSYIQNMVCLILLADISGMEYIFHRHRSRVIKRHHHQTLFSHKLDFWLCHISFRTAYYQRLFLCADG